MAKQGKHFTLKENLKVDVIFQRGIDKTWVK